MIENKLEKINQLSDQLTELINPFISYFPNDIEQSKTPKTLRLVFYMMDRIKEISQGILDTTYNYNNYSSNILLRTLIEHFLQFSYAIDFLNENKDDSLGEKYYDYRFIKEEKDYYNSIVKQIKILKNKDEENNAVQYLSENKPDLNKYSNSQLDENNKQFKVGSIIDYLLRNVDFENIDYDKEIPELHFIKHHTTYCYLSSYIHGGPFAERMLIKYKGVDKRNQRLIHMAETSFVIYHGTFLLGLTVLGVMTNNRNYIELSEKVGKINFK